MKNSRSVQGIREAVKTIAGPSPERIVMCVVTSIDTTNYLLECVPISGKAPLTDIKIKPSSNDAVIPIPAVDSYVLVGMINETDGYVIQSDAETLEILGNASTAVRFDELKAGFDQLVSDFNALVSSYNAHTHPGITPGSSTSAPTVSQGTTSNADIDNSEVPEVKIGK